MIVGRGREQVKAIRTYKKGRVVAELESVVHKYGIQQSPLDRMMRRASYTLIDGLIGALQSRPY